MSCYGWRGEPDQTFASRSTSCVNGHPMAAIGKQVRAYLRETRDEGLLISGEGMEKVEALSTVEVYSDASYTSSELKSLTGIVACVGGTPVAWQTTRQAFITLSTAEAELTSMLESLVTVRSIGALVEASLGTKATLKLHSDSTAIAIAAGTTSSWGTRHLRIRAAGLTEALRTKEVTLRHVAGVELVADGMTKQLIGQALRNFKKTLGIKKAEMNQKVEVKKFKVSGGDRVAQIVIEKIWSTVWMSCPRQPGRPEDLAIQLMKNFTPGLNQMIHGTNIKKQAPETQWIGFQLGP